MSHRRTHWHFLFALSLVISASLMAPPSVASTVKLYKASKVNGRVLTRGSNDARWSRVVEGSLLREGQIIQVTDGAQVTLDDWVRAEEGHTNGERVQLKLTQPIIARLSQDLLRKVKTTTHFMDKVASATAGPTSNGTDEQPLSLSDAWNKVSTVFTGKAPIAPMPDLNQLAKEGMAMGVSAHKIRLLAPATNHVIPAVAWPVELKIVWITPPEKKLRYHVYVWPVAQPRGEPIAVTTTDYMKAPIKSPGAYMVQIMSHDQAWQSQAHAFHVILAGKSQVAGQDSSQIMSKNDALAVSYPPENFNILSTSPTVDQTFAWVYDAPANQKTNFILEIIEKNKSQKRTFRSVTNFASVPLVAGSYLWTVRLEGSDLKTEPRYLQLLNQNKSNKPFNLRNFLKNEGTPQQGKSIFFASGL